MASPDPVRLFAQALAPTLSLLRLSAAQRLAGVALLIGGLWALVFAVLG